MDDSKYMNMSLQEVKMSRTILEECIIGSPPPTLSWLPLGCCVVAKGILFFLDQHLRIVLLVKE